MAYFEGEKKGGGFGVEITTRMWQTRSVPSAH
jgi:hypothetical protein